MGFKRRPPIRIAAAIALAVAARLVIWTLIPTDRFASDESSYYHTGISLATQGTQDTFFPPVVGWIIATLRFVLPSAGLKSVRLVWVLMDLASALLLWLIARRMVGNNKSDFASRHFPALVALAYLIYIPAISFSQFATSETPAVLLVLAALACLTAGRPHFALRFAFAGLLTGVLVLTRTNLASLLVTLPLATALVAGTDEMRIRVSKIFLFTFIACLVVGGWLWRNYHYEGRLFLSANSSYNFHIGNAAVYQEDLNLFSPAATPEQIAFRKQLLSGQPIPASIPTSDEIRQQAIEQLRNHKTLFLRRALGRFARLFVPRTDELELLGGENRATVFSFRSLTLLLVTNLQWALILVCGVAGLLAIWKTRRQFFIWFTAIIAGAIPLCLLAIAKPRYGFVFEPLLLLCAVSLLSNPARNWRQLARGARVAFYLLMVFFAWSWVAWLIFAFTSRL